MFYRKFIKPLLDRSAAFMLLILLSPLLLVLSVLLYFANAGKPFFVQRRAGKGGQVFSILKFRTMNDRRDASGRLLPDAQRLTPVGRVVRKASLDELPQLFNILRGEMSFVGPRPLLPEYLPHYTAAQARRHDVLPGITGLAQIKGRNVLKFSERLVYDVEYVERIGFYFDLLLLVLTVKTVLLGSSQVVHGQEVTEVDDIGLSKDLNP